MKYFSIIILLLIIGQPFYAQTTQEIIQARTKIDLNANWQFRRGELEKRVTQTNFDDSSWKTVNVPHTMELVSNDIYAMGDKATQEFFQRYIGYYRKKLNINAKAGQKVFLEFEGAHQVTNCWVNGEYVGEHAIGSYTPFHFDITPYLNKNEQENTIVLSVDKRKNPNIPPDGGRMDYLMFSGLYRDVYLVITNPVHVTFNWEAQQAGIFITTPSVTKNNATIQVKATVRNETSLTKSTKVVNRIVDANGLLVQKTETAHNIPPNSDFTFRQATGITEDVYLWSIDNPYLYTCQTLIYDDGRLSDAINTRFGIRKLDFVDGKGLLLNGEPVELIGTNKHQAYPFLGDAVPNALLKKDAYQIKEAGMNVVRLAHYPHDNAFLEACDELGLLVLEEAPTWIEMPRGKWFENLVEATRIMIRNHRNHPSVFLWSAGINHRGPVEQLHYACKEEDPSRMTGSNGSPWTGPIHSGIADIYTPMDYQNMPITENDFSFLCEHGSSKDAIRNQQEVARSRASNNRFGVALWTAHDYFSFQRDWGMVPRRPWSIFRVPNPVTRWYQSEMLPAPMVYIADERVSENEVVSVFSNCSEVALYNDDQLVAQQQPDSDPLRIACKHPSFTFRLANPRGTLVAVGYQLGRPIVRDTLFPKGKPSQIKLVIEEEESPFWANGSDMRWVRAYLLDENENLVTLDTSLVKFSILGAGTIIGDQSIGANPNKAYYGIASALIRSSQVGGEITISATAKGLTKATATIQTMPYNPNIREQTAIEVKEYPKAKIDIGGKGQYEQFEWISWSDDHTQKSSIALPDFNATLSISSKNSDLEWSAPFGLSGNLPYVALDGVKVKPEGTLILNIAGLPKGRYELISYHHQLKKPVPKEIFTLAAKQPNNYEITVTDSGGKRIAIPALQPSNGTRQGFQFPKSATYFIHSDGINPIEIITESQAKDIPVILNGLELSFLGRN